MGGGNVRVVATPINPTLQVLSGVRNIRKKEFELDKNTYVDANTALDKIMISVNKYNEHDLYTVH